MKKFFTMIVSVALLATMVVGGTLANEILSPLNFGESTTELITQNITNGNNVNLPSNGDVWNMEAYPAIYGTDAVTSAENKSTLDFAKVTGNVIDYSVSVTNQSNKPVYVRTVFAFENTNGLADKLYFNRNEDQTKVEWQDVAGDAEINGKKYKLMVCIYKDAIGANQTSVKSLHQFCFDKDIKDFGADSYQIMVKSQAIQAETIGDQEQSLNLDTAKVLFGNIDTLNHPWSEVTNTNI